MTILTAHNLGKFYGSRCVFHSLSFTLGRGEKVAVVGRNGEGKTTLLRVIAGELEPDEGSVWFSARASMGYLSQNLSLSGNLLASTIASRKDIADLWEKMKSLEHSMASPPNPSSAEVDRVLQEYGKVTARFEALDGYSLEYKARSILAGLGFSEDNFNKDLSVLSGGERVRAALARLLLQESDLLLLDEPTNHLDLSGVEWLESFLANYGGAVLMVSHDRYFIDKLADKVLELEAAHGTTYTGNYTAYLNAKELEIRQKEEAYRRQQELIWRTREFIQKWKADKRRTRQARSREKMLERLEIVEKPRKAKRSMGIRFEMTMQTGNEVMDIIDLGKSYPVSQGAEDRQDSAGLRRLFARFTWKVRNGDRVALIGPNGCGKTTLLRCLLGIDDEYEGEVVWGHNVQAGYFTQGFQDLDDESTVLEEIGELGLDNQEARDLLGRFLFSGDDVYKKVGSLSGGEKNRLALARLVVSEANLLVLDEPTNHLDVASKEALEGALQDFPGTIICASHDRFFIDRLATHLWVFDGTRIRVFKGTYSEYRVAFESGGPVLYEDDMPSFRAQAGNFEEQGKKGVDGSKETTRALAGPAKPRQIKGKGIMREALRQSRSEQSVEDVATQELLQVESCIEVLEQRREELDGIFANPAFYDDPASLPWKEHGQIEKELEAMYKKWEEIASRIARKEGASR